MKKLFVSSLLLTLCWTSGAEERPYQRLLYQGKLPEARQLVEPQLLEHPERHDLRFQLGLAQFLGCVEKLSQDLHRLGSKDSIFGSTIPFLRFPTPPNPQASGATNASVRQVIVDFSLGVQAAGKTLESIPDNADFKIPVALGKVHLDFNGDGRVDNEEALWRVYKKLNPGTNLTEETGPKLGAHFDVADARWLQGYTHVLAGLADTVLAYDTARLFDYTGHLFFENPAIPYPFLQENLAKWEQQFGGNISDAIAFIHLIQLPVAEPQRLQSALAHFEQVTALSRRSWACIMAETDDAYEWVPSPRQRPIFRDGAVTAEMVKTWHEFLDEADSLLAGKTLLPFWRGGTSVAGKGINLRKIFLEPTPLDAVLWVQGTAAVPYMEAGTVTKADFWTRLNRVFRQNFMGFAIWFN